jgi:hypothetical protein
VLLRHLWPSANSRQLVPPHESVAFNPADQPITQWAGTNLRIYPMNELFSHPYQPDAAYHTEHDSEPVQAPVFSDLPKKQPAATPR